MRVVKKQDRQYIYTYIYMRQRASLLALANEIVRWASTDVGLPLTGFSERRCLGILIFELEVQLPHIMSTLGGHFAKVCVYPFA